MTTLRLRGVPAMKPVPAPSAPAALRISRHAVLRAAQRYGLALDEAGLKEIGEMCRSGRAVLLAKLDGPRCRYAVNFAGQAVAVVWDAARDCIVTLLPRAALSDSRGDKPGKRKPKNGMTPKSTRKRWGSARGAGK